MKVIKCKRKVMNTSETKETGAFGGKNNHKGSDLVPKSTAETPDILAYDSGAVIAVGNYSGNATKGNAAMGTYVAIKHDNGLVTRYQHLKYNCNKVVKGQRVKQGQAIGVYGRPITTGNSTGCHLHFDISAPVNLGGKVISGTFCGEARYYVDPIPYLELKTGTVTGDVNVRTGPGTGFKIVGEKKSGEGITIYGISGSWYRISPNLPRWVHKNYIKEW